MIGRPITTRTVAAGAAVLAALSLASCAVVPLTIATGDGAGERGCTSYAATSARTGEAGVACLPLALPAPQPAILCQDGNCLVTDPAARSYDPRALLGYLATPAGERGVTPCTAYPLTNAVSGEPAGSMCLPFAIDAPATWCNVGVCLTVGPASQPAP